MNGHHNREQDQHKLSRRKVLQLGSKLAILTIGGPILASCGGGGGGGTPTAGMTSPSPSPASPSPAAPGVTPEATPAVSMTPSASPTPASTAATGATGWQVRFKEQATITAWGFNTDNTTARVRVNLFKQTYPNIQLRLVPEITDQKILTAVASGQVPDLFWIGRNSVISWAARGALEPLNDLIENDDRFNMDNFYESAVKEVTWDDQIWAIPQFMDVRALWINHKPLQEVGIKPDDVDPKNWNQLQQYGVKLTKKQGNRLTRWGFDHKVQDGYMWMWSWANNSNLLSEDGRTATFATPENVEALRYAAETIQKQGGWKAFDAFRQTWQWDAQHPVIQNQVALTLYESWLLGMIAEFAPDHPFNVIPFTDKSGKIVTAVGGLAWAIPKGAKNKEAAWEFISFMSDAQVWLRGAKAQANEEKGKYVPSLTANKEADKLLREQVYSPINDAIDSAVALFPRLLNNSQAPPPSPVNAEINDILNNDAVLPALRGEKSPEDALKAAQEKAQAAIDKFFK